MENVEKQLTEKESLDVINRMIEQARNKFEKGDGKYFLLWGYLIAIVSLAHFALLMYDVTTANSAVGILWNVATALGIIVTVVFVVKDARKSVVSTYSSTILNSVWIGFAVMATTVSVLLSGKAGALIYPAITALYAFAIFMSARALRIKWMIWCAVACLVCVVLYRFLPPVYWPLLMAVAIIAGNILPGHFINSKAGSNV